MVRIKCKECGEVVSGQTEYDAEVQWTMHECPNTPDVKNLSLSELRRLAYEAADDIS